MTPCIEWTGSVRKDGYGRRWLKQLGVTTAHRAAWVEANGPTELDIRHLCHNRLCVNLEHLAPGTEAENLQDNRDAQLPVNQHDGKQFCKHGHLLTAQNVRIRLRANGHRERVCRTCDGATTFLGRWPG
jgi:hypothetical protein